MFGLDEAIADLGVGGSLLVVALVAALLGLRHATDPDHLTAVSTLIVGDREHAPRRAAWLGLSWGLGHATTLFALGLPFVLFGSLLPERAQTAAEVLIAVVIVALAVRLLVRWHRGLFHSHLHRHGDLVHAHPHAHDHARAHQPTDGAATPVHAHTHAETVRRSPLGAYGIGLVHGIGGSAGVSLLLLATITDRSVAVLSLVLLVAFTALAMAAASTGVGYGLTRPRVRRHLPRLAPALGGVSLAFGLWYGLGALEFVPYLF